MLIQCIDKKLDYVCTLCYNKEHRKVGINMSLNVSGSMFVRVYNTEIKLQVSDKIVFAHLSTSRKTGKNRVDTETGEILVDEQGNPLPERRFSSWNAKFVGNAFEPSKGIAPGEAINIINGWVTNEPFRNRDGAMVYSPVVTVTEFEVCEVAEGDEEQDGTIDG